MADLARIIPTGKENAIHQEELARVLGVSTAMAKIMVREARQNGVVILSGVQGYWIPKDDTERKRFVATLKKQAFTRMKTAKQIQQDTKQEPQNVPGQMELFEIYGELAIE